MSNIYIKGLKATNLSISGDEGIPSINVSINESVAVPSVKAIGNVLFCDSCAAFITSGNAEVRIGSVSGRILTASEMEAIKSGSLFDLNDDGTADQAEKNFGAVSDDIDALTVAETIIKLTGDGSGKFVPKSLVILCTEDDTVSVVPTVSVGTTTGGTEILAATLLTGLTAADKCYLIDLILEAGAIVDAIADNADIFINVTVKATATSQSIKVALEGSVL